MTPAGRSRAGSADRNTGTPPEDRPEPCRSPCGSADRNTPTAIRCGSPIWSLPVRERGSKRLDLARIHILHRSLPVRERGSKQRIAGRQRPDRQSLPVRERGSKHRDVEDASPGPASLPVRERGSKLYALAGPVRERGSKRHAGHRLDQARAVAPRAGARIETTSSPRWRASSRVAPRAGARIETRSRRRSWRRPARRSPCGERGSNSGATRIYLVWRSRRKRGTVWVPNAVMRRDADPHQHRVKERRTGQHGKASPDKRQREGELQPTTRP